VNRYRNDFVNAQLIRGWWRRWRGDACGTCRGRGGVKYPPGNVHLYAWLRCPLCEGTGTKGRQ
jgi:DnaJ-class molecular chaperone